MSSRPVSTVPNIRRNEDAGQATKLGAGTVDIQAPRKSSVLQELLPPEESISQKLLNQINGDEGAGLAISLIIHIILLAMLAIPVIQYTRESQVFTTLVENTDETIEFDAPIETAIPLPVVDSSGGDPESELLEMKFESVGSMPNLELADKPVAPGDEASAGSDGEEGGSRVAEPKNAVIAGNFSVWPWPIKGLGMKPDLRNPQLGDPGQDPRPFQNYLIIIRIRAPAGTKSLKITDFSGTVVGTDGYTQQIPEGCFQFTPTGQLIPIRLRPRIPVLDGTAELVVLVPGAEALVEDTINIRSETLDEEQEIKLVFKPRNFND